jgi:hypothetical protein
VIIIHGRYDFVCPLAAGYSLAKTLPNAEYKVLEHAGHIAEGEQMIDALVSAGEKMATKRYHLFHASHQPKHIIHYAAYPVHVLN